jgi:hypothetical protein
MLLHELFSKNPQLVSKAFNLLEAKEEVKVILYQKM